MIYLSLGSNIGDRAWNIRQACRLLCAQNVSIERVSSFYETAPVGVTDQPAFFNVVLAVTTKHSPQELLAICLDIERQLGRVRLKKWGPRTIDIDLILYHNEVIQTDTLQLPHPYFSVRRFVLTPLAEIAGDEPILNEKTAKQLLDEVTDSSWVRKANAPFKVLFLTLPIGSGHVRAAQAIEQSLLTEAEQGALSVQTFSYDLFASLPQIGVQFFLTAYLKLLRVFPCFYGWLYRWGNRPRQGVASRTVINRLLARKLKPVLAKFHPDLVVATHASAAGAWLQLVHCEPWQDVPLWSIITDFVVHRWWHYPAVSRYFVAHEQMKKALLAAGISAPKVTVTGIPVDSSFQKTDTPSESLKQHLGMEENIPVVLLIGGGDGILPLEPIVHELDQINLPFQLLAVTGRNAQAFERLRECQGKLQHHLQVYSYIENIAELMLVADFLITKAGGMTLAEALSLARPIILYRPLPGQERANASYLEKAKAARIAESPADLKAIFVDLLQNQSAFQETSEAARALGKPLAAHSIAKAICTKLRYFYKIT